MDWRRLDLNGLKVLHALMLERAVARAAERLHLSPSAVSHRLRDLREGFADPLFVRTPQGMQPTPRMEEIGVALSAVIASLETATSTEFVPAQARLTFHIVATEAITAPLLPLLAPLLRRETPNCTLRISRFERRDYTNDLLNGAADLVLSVGGHTPRSAGIGVEPLIEDVLLVLAGPASSLWERTDVDVPCYLDLPHIYSLPWPVEANHLDQVLALDHKARQIRMTVPDHALAAEIAAVTDLVATMPGCIARRLSSGRADLRVRKCPIRGAGHVALEWATDRARTSRGLWLRERVLEHFRFTPVHIRLP